MNASLVSMPTLLPCADKTVGPCNTETTHRIIESSHKKSTSQLLRPSISCPLFPRYALCLVYLAQLKIYPKCPRLFCPVLSQLRPPYHLLYQHQDHTSVDTPAEKSQRWTAETPLSVPSCKTPTLLAKVWILSAHVLICVSGSSRVLVYESTNLAPATGVRRALLYIWNSH